MQAQRIPNSRVPETGSAKTINTVLGAQPTRLGLDDLKKIPIPVRSIARKLDTRSRQEMGEGMSALQHELFELMEIANTIGPVRTPHGDKIVLISRPFPREAGGVLKPAFELNVVIRGDVIASVRGYGGSGVEIHRKGKVIDSHDTMRFGEALQAIFTDVASRKGVEIAFDHPI